MDKLEKYYVDRLIKIEWGFNDYYKMNFITPENYFKITSILSEIRANKKMEWQDWSIMANIYKVYYKQFFKIKELINNEPRRHAQLFIGRKKIRQFIFKRDNYKCLCCGSKNNLSIDHIKPINKGGENKISNLQTLCRSCNSKKSDTFKDYR